MALRLQIISRHRQSLGERAAMEFGRNGGTIGRSLESDWVLPDGQRYMSSRHASIDFRSGSYYIVDTSTNGVYVNESEQPVGRGNPQRLFTGDRIRIGEYEMSVEITDEDDTRETLTNDAHVDPGLEGAARAAARSDASRHGRAARDHGGRHRDADQRGSRDQPDSAPQQGERREPAARGRLRDERSRTRSRREAERRANGPAAAPIQFEPSPVGAAEPKRPEPPPVSAAARIAQRARRAPQKRERQPLRVAKPAPLPPRAAHGSGPRPVLPRRGPAAACASTTSRPSRCCSGSGRSCARSCSA